MQIVRIFVDDLGGPDLFAGGTILGNERFYIGHGLGDLGSAPELVSLLWCLQYGKFSSLETKKLVWLFDTIIIFIIFNS